MVFIKMKLKIVWYVYLEELKLHATHVSACELLQVQPLSMACYSLNIGGLPPILNTFVWMKLITLFTGLINYIYFFLFFFQTQTPRLSYKVPTLHNILLLSLHITIFKTFFVDVLYTICLVCFYPRWFCSPW